jgi:hypothetical protein
VVSYKVDGFVKSRRPVEKGGQVSCNYLKILDSSRTRSGIRRNDEKWSFSTFYEFVNVVPLLKKGARFFSSSLTIVDSCFHLSAFAAKAGRNDENSPLRAFTSLSRLFHNVII